MSPCPSPIGTDPINGFKMVQNGSRLCKSVSAIAEQNAEQKPARPSLWKITNWPSKANKSQTITEIQLTL